MDDSGIPVPPADQQLERAACIEDLHALARERLSPVAYDYFHSGAGSEWTLRRNRAAFDDWTFVKRVLVDVSAPELSIDLLGTRLDVPVVVCPTAMHQLACPEGEVATARGVRERGSLMIMSTLATLPLEDVAATGVARWFQLYVQRDRGWTAELVHRARDAGFTALVLTVDTPELGDRWTDVRRPFRLPDGLVCAHLGGDPSAAGDGLRGFVDAFDDSLGWEAVEWLRDVSDLPVVVKGVTEPEDARQCLDVGAAAVMVSNHGGRQLDHDTATLDVLPAVVEVVGGAVPVILDGGVRTGTDVVTALCLGATAVGVGRPVLWGLAAGGRAGVARALQLLQDGAVDTVRQLGAPTRAELTPDRLRPAPHTRP